MTQAIPSPRRSTRKVLHLDFGVIERKGHAMLEPCHPTDEQLRLKALQALRILDTEAEERFDRITALACELLGVPICLISLVDAERQWFKSRQGLDAEETPRNISFCGHAILDHETLVVENALEDPRFADNPLVTGAPDIRFYAGHPLATKDGHCVGTLCVIDKEPKVLTEQELRTLQQLAHVVQSELRSREELNRYTLELTDATIRIRKSADAKAEYLAHMSHELRSPIMSILGYAELLDQESKDEETVEEYTNIIRSSGEYLLALVNDVLDHAKVEAGRMQVERIDIDLPTLLVDVDRLMRIRAAEKGIELHLECEGPIPTRIQSDPVRLRQILVNLVGNAVKFTKEGHVSVRAKMDGDKLSISVEDTGIGMKLEQADHIFEAFGQADVKVTREFGGTGLGLAISRELAFLLGGTIEVESEFGRGSRFNLILDPGSVDDVPTAESMTPITEDVAKFAEDKKLRGRVLVVEDNAVNRRLLERILESEGLETESAENGQEAIDKTLESLRKRQPFEVILMDMVMPVVDGYAATSALRSEGYFGSIIALTGNACESDREKCLHAGCDEFLTKPVDRVALRNTLERRLSQPPALRSY